MTTPLLKMDNSLSEIFGTNPITDVPVKEQLPAVPQDSPAMNIAQMESDSSDVRENIQGLIAQGSDALEYALELAKASDSPRAFEVVSTLLGQMTEMNMKILDIHERMAKAKQVSSSTGGTEQSANKIVNNSIVFQGSTLELSKMLSSMREENK